VRVRARERLEEREKKAEGGDVCSFIFFFFFFAERFPSRSRAGTRRTTTTI
jgi:hypothetical protein